MLGTDSCIRERPLYVRFPAVLYEYSRSSSSDELRYLLAAGVLPLCREISHRAHSPSQLAPQESHVRYIGEQRSQLTELLYDYDCDTRTHTIISKRGCTCVHEIRDITAGPNLLFLPAAAAAAATMILLLLDGVYDICVKQYASNYVVNLRISTAAALQTSRTTKRSRSEGPLLHNASNDSVADLPRYTDCCCEVPVSQHTPLLMCLARTQLTSVLSNSGPSAIGSRCCAICACFACFAIAIVRLSSHALRQKIRRGLYSIRPASTVGNAAAMHDGLCVFQRPLPL